LKVRTKLIGTVVLGATLLVPVAQAQRPDDQAGPRGPGAIAQVNGVAVRGEVKDGVGTPPSTDVIVGDDKRDSGARPTAGGLVGDDKQGLPQNNQYSQFAYRRALPQDLGPQAAVVVSHPDNRAGVRGPGAVAVGLVQPGSSGFDWGDALIGGLAGAGAALILTGCAFFLMSQRQRVRTA
jgi:hypothetical protein